MAELMIDDFVVLPYPADWREPPRVRLLHMSSLSSAGSGAESRGSRWHARRRRMTWQIVTRDPSESAQVGETIRAGQEAMQVAAPYFPAFNQVEQINGLSLQLSGVLRGVSVGGWLWWYDMQSDSGGVVRITGLGPGSVRLAEVPAQLSVGSLVAPVLYGSLAEVQVEEVGAGRRCYTLTLMEDLGRGTGTASTLKIPVSLFIHPEGLIENLSPERRLQDTAWKIQLQLDGAIVSLVVSSAATEASPLVIGVGPGLYQRIALTPGDQHEPATMAVRPLGTYA